MLSDNLAIKILYEIETAAERVNRARRSMLMAMNERDDNIFCAFKTRGSMTVRELAEKVGLSASMIYKIVAEQTWYHDCSKSCDEYISKALIAAENVRCYRSEYIVAMGEFINVSIKNKQPLYWVAPLVGLHYTRLYDLYKQFKKLEEK